MGQSLAEAENSAKPLGPIPETPGEASWNKNQLSKREHRFSSGLPPPHPPSRYLQKSREGARESRHRSRATHGVRELKRSAENKSGPAGV